MQLHLMIFVFHCTFDAAKRPRRATELDMTKFHSDDYIQFLKLVSPDNMNEYAKQLQRCM